MVKAAATQSGALAGTVAIMGCLKVTDEAGSRLLSGREAETFRNALADEPPEYRMRVRARPAALLADLAVVPAQRRAGLGRALCDRAMNRAARWGYGDVYL